jgi:hypothetical protein
MIYASVNVKKIDISSSSHTGFTGNEKHQKKDSFSSCFFAGVISYTVSEMGIRDIRILLTVLWNGCEVLLFIGWLDDRESVGVGWIMERERLATETPNSANGFVSLGKR